MSNLNNKKTAKENSILSWIVSALILIAIWTIITLYNLSMQKAYERGRIEAYNDMYSNSEECSDEVLQ